MASLAYKQHWTEPRIEPLSMTDTEIIDWLDEYCDGAFQIAGATETARIFIIESEGISTTRASTLREAVCLAAAKLNEANQ